MTFTGRALIFLIICYPGMLFGQYKQLLHESYKEKAPKLQRLYEKAGQMQDSLRVESFTNELKTFAVQHNDKELSAEADLLKAYVFSSLNDKTGKREHPKKSLKAFRKIAERAKQENLIYIQERAVYALALGYWLKQKYERAFTWMLRCSALLDQMEPEGFPFMATHLNFIGRCYYYFKNYDRALEFFKKAGTIDRTSFNANAVHNAQNSVGLCYQKQRRFKAAKRVFKTIIKDTATHRSIIWKGIASGNLGHIYYLEEKYKKAIPLFKKDIKNAEKISDYGLASGSTILLADVYLKQGDLIRSQNKWERAKTFIDSSKQTDRLRKLYPVISKWYAAAGKSDSSAAYLDSAMTAAKKYNQKYSQVKLMRAQQNIQKKARQLRLEKIHSETRLKLSQRNFIIGIILLMLVISLLAYWFRNKYLIKKRKAAKLALINAQNTLENTKQKLRTLTQKTKNDNELIDKLKKADRAGTNKKVLSELRSQNILTQEDWEQFRENFTRVYPNFIRELQALRPKPTKAEVRCLCMMKLNFSNNEMALASGVSSNTIRVTQYRLRKKLNLDSTELLDKFVRNLGRDSSFKIQP